MKISPIDVYSPGVAIECVLGTLLGIWLGLDLVRFASTKKRSDAFLTSIVSVSLCGHVHFRFATALFERYYHI